MTAQRMVGRKVAERKVAQRMMGRQMMCRHRRRGLLRDGVAGEAYGKYGRDGEDLDHWGLPSTFEFRFAPCRVSSGGPPHGHSGPSGAREAEVKGVSALSGLDPTAAAPSRSRSRRLDRNGSTRSSW